MNTRLHLSLLAAIALSMAAQGVLAWDTKASSNLGSQVRISKEKARQLALDRSPQGTVKKERLEQEGDKRIWVVDIARYREPNHVTTVRVDAETGAVQSSSPHAPSK